MKRVKVGTKPRSKRDYPNDMDAECVGLCDALNSFPGIRTVESCCGHGSSDFNIWFVARSLRDLPPVLYFFDGCHTFYGWRVIAQTDCAMSPVSFRVEGPKGREAYDQANLIAEAMMKFIERGTP